MKYIKKLNTHDIVVSLYDIPDIPKGSVGTVVHIYENGKAYEIEFNVNDSIIVETLLNNQIKLL